MALLYFVDTIIHYIRHKSKHFNPHFFKTTNQSLANIIKQKVYHIYNAKINANSSYNLTIDDISGYTPIGAFYDCTSGETVTAPICPRRKKNTGVIQCLIINQHSSAMTTSGDLYVYYVKQYYK